MIREDITRKRVAERTQMTEAFGALQDCHPSQTMPGPGLGDKGKKILSIVFSILNGRLL